MVTTVAVQTSQEFKVYYPSTQYVSETIPFVRRDTAPPSPGEEYRSWTKLGIYKKVTK